MRAVQRSSSQPWMYPFQQGQAKLLQLQGGPRVSADAGTQLHGHAEHRVLAKSRLGQQAPGAKGHTLPMEEGVHKLLYHSCIQCCPCQVPAVHPPSLPRPLLAVLASPITTPLLSPPSLPPAFSSVRANAVPPSCRTVLRDRVRSNMVTRVSGNPGGRA